MFNVEEQKIGITVRDNPEKHLHRLYAMRISVGETWSTIYILDREIKGNRATLRREKSRTIDMPRQARALARHWKILRNNIEVVYEDSEPKTKKAK
jgi:hypothetical protein